VLDRQQMEEEQQQQSEAKPACINRGPVSLFFGGAVLASSVFIGLDTQVRATGGSDSLKLLMFIAEFVFMAIFFVELLMRICADRCPKFLYSAWNLLDAFLVVSSVVDVFVEFVSRDDSGAAGELGKFRAVRLLKITRALRLIRIIRVFRFRALLRLMRGLIVLVQAIIEAMRALGWLMAMFVVATYIFAIVTTEFVGLADEQDDPLLNEWFGDMFKSMFTLMQISTLEDWAIIARHVADKLGGHWLIIFVVYVLTTNLVLLNVVLATLIHKVISLNTDLKSAQAGQVTEETDDWMLTPSSLASDDEDEGPEDKPATNQGGGLASGVVAQNAAERLTMQILSEFFDITSEKVGIEGLNQRKLVTQRSLGHALQKPDVQEKLFQVCPSMQGLEPAELPARILAACPKQINRDGLLRQELAEACLALRGELSMNHFVGIGRSLQQMERHIDHELVHLNKHQRKMNRRFLKLRNRLRKAYRLEDGAPRRRKELQDAPMSRNARTAATETAPTVAASETPADTAAAAEVEEDEEDGSEAALSKSSQSDGDGW